MPPREDVYGQRRGRRVTIRRAFPCPPWWAPGGATKEGGHYEKTWLD